MNKTLKNVLGIVFIALLIFTFRGEIKRGFAVAKKEFFPCREPIEYSLGVFDKRFGVSEEYFMTAIQKAEAIWEVPIGVNLFEGAEGGALKINLAYDARQEATEKLREIDRLIDSDRQKHELLKSDYDSLKVEYANLKKDFEQRVKAFEANKAEFQVKADYWNDRGGAPEAEYKKLEAERAKLNQEAESLESLQANLNKKIDEINAHALALNELARKMNKGVTHFNDIADDHGEEFEEGNYESDSLGERINVYQFEDETKLVRVLAHEFGHALGLSHGEDPDSIMYRLNDSKNQKATEEDLDALRAKCKVKSVI